MSEGLEDLYNIDHLYESFICTKAGTDWKESVQRYEINLLENLTKVSRELQDGTFRFKPVIEFKLSERGHTRFIKSHHIYDRVVLLCFVKFVLLPKVLPKVIYDNAASITGRGVAHARKRLCVHLNRFYKEHGNKGYIRLFDFSKFYDNIRHDKALELFRPLLNNEEFNFLKLNFKHFEFDLSPLSDEEFIRCRDGVFNSLNYINIPKDARTGEKMLHKSVGIGSPVSQTIGIYYPKMIDDYVKTVRGCKYYARYNDDFYIISDTLENLNSLTAGILKICREYGLYLNPRKIKTIPLSREFVYLKIAYRLKDNGRIVKRALSENFRRERRRLRKFQNLYRADKMTREYALKCYKTWRGNYLKFDNKRQIRKTDALFIRLFDYKKGEKPWKKTKTSKQMKTKQT